MIRSGNEGIQTVINGLLDTVGVEVEEEICRCSAFVRSSGPILPLRNGSIIAIGEVAGLTSPLSGDGSIPDMFSALFLTENWGDSDASEKAILKKYGYFQKEAEALKRLMKGKVLTPSNILAAIRLLHFIDGHVAPGQFMGIMRIVRWQFTSSQP